MLLSSWDVCVSVGLSGTRQGGFPHVRHLAAPKTSSSIAWFPRWAVYYNQHRNASLNLGCLGAGPREFRHYAQKSGAGSIQNAWVSRIYFSRYQLDGLGAGRLLCAQGVLGTRTPAKDVTASPWQLIEQRRSDNSGRCLVTAPLEH